MGRKKKIYLELYEGNNMDKNNIYISNIKPSKDGKVFKKNKNCLQEIKDLVEKTKQEKEQYAFLEEK